MGGAPIIIPLVALVIPILFLLVAIVFDAAIISWVVYRVWHDRGHTRSRRLQHRSPLTNESAILLQSNDAPPRHCS